MISYAYFDIILGTGYRCKPLKSLGVATPGAMFGIYRR